VLDDIFKDIRGKSDEEMKQLIQSKYGSLNYQQLAGLLHYATSMEGNANIIRVLISMDADVNALNPLNGYMPIHNAVVYGIVDAIDALLPYLSDIDIADKNGLTPLFYATLSKEISNTKVAKLLIENGADISDPYVRFTLLSSAKKVGNTAMIDYLSRIFVGKEQTLADQNKDEDKDEGNQNNAEYHYQQGKEYREKGLFSQAVNEFTKCLNIDPNHAHALYSRGMSRLMISETEEAIKDFSQAINKIAPQERWEYYAGRGTAYYITWQMNKPMNAEKAIFDIKKIIAVNPPESVLADAKRMLGELEKSK